MNSEYAINILGFVFGSLLFAFIQLLQLDIEEWKERKKNKDEM